MHTNAKISSRLQLAVWALLITVLAISVTAMVYAAQSAAIGTGGDKTGHVATFKGRRDLVAGNARLVNGTLQGIYDVALSQSTASNKAIPSLATELRNLAADITALQSISITGTGGVSGGGHLSSNLSLQLAVHSLGVKDMPSGEDYTVIHDAVTGTHKKILLGNLPASDRGGASLDGEGKVPTTQISEDSVTQHEAAIDHDALLNFVANEHIDHSAVSISTGTASVTGLSGGGDLTSTRNITLDVNALTAKDTPVTGDYALIHDTVGAAPKKVLLSDLPPAIDHDTLLNFVANEHIDHSAVSISTGAASVTGLTGGGDLTSTRNITLDVNALTAKGTPVTGDYALIHDTAGSAPKKVLLSDLPVAAPHLPAYDFSDFNLRGLQAFVGNRVINGDHTIGTYDTNLTGVSNGGYSDAIFDPINDRIWYIPFLQGQELNWHYWDCSSQTMVSYANGAGITVNLAYRGGVFSPLNNRIYMIPYGQAGVANWHYIDCNESVATNAVKSYVHGVTAYSYNGGVYSPTQNIIVMVPYSNHNQLNWHYIDCSDGLVKTYTHSNVANLTSGRTHGCYAPTLNRIYFCPWQRQGQCHYFDCNEPDINDAIKMYTIPNDTDAYYAGAIYSPLNNRIYFIPSDYVHGTYWHYIDCDTGDCVAYTHGLTSPELQVDGNDGNGSYHGGGAYHPTLNRIYLAPSGQADVANWHYIDCFTGSVISYAHGTTQVHSAYARAVFSPPENRVYFVPWNSPDNASAVYIAPEYADESMPGSRRLQSLCLWSH